jgi:hypothetical protein
MSKHKSVNALARRLADMLAELANHPKTQKVIDEAAHMAHTDGGVDLAATGELTIAIALLAREFASLGDIAASDNRDHWEQEAECAGVDDDSDTIDECERLQKKYAIASEAFSNATLSIAKAIGNLRDGMAQADIK